MNSTCGTCKFGITVPGADGTMDFKRRTCYGKPPTPVFVIGPAGGHLQGVRPSVAVTDAACSLYKPTSVNETNGDQGA